MAKDKQIKPARQSVTSFPKETPFKGLKIPPPPPQGRITTPPMPDFIARRPIVEKAKNTEIATKAKAKPIPSPKRKS